MLLIRILLVVIAYMGSIATPLLIYMGLMSGYSGHVFGFWLPPSDEAFRRTIFTAFVVCLASAAGACVLALLIGPDSLRKRVALPTIYVMLCAGWFLWNAFIV